MNKFLAKYVYPVNTVLALLGGFGTSYGFTHNKWIIATGCLVITIIACYSPIANYKSTRS